MTATYTFDVFSSLDGFGTASGGWGGYWGKQGPELLEHRLAVYSDKQRMVLGANTYRAFAQLLASNTEETVHDAWVTRMRHLPATVVSNTLQGSLDWPDATVVRGDAVDVVARLKQESEVPLRSHGSLSMNRALMAAGLVDRVQVTLFPVITGQTGADPPPGSRRAHAVQLASEDHGPAGFHSLTHRSGPVHAAEAVVARSVWQTLRLR